MKEDDKVHLCCIILALIPDIMLYQHISDISSMTKKVMLLCWPC